MTGRRFGVAAAFLAVLAPGARAQTPDAAPYLDDRSTPEAVLRSLYNAVDRGEIVRAWSYFRDTPERPDFETFRRGYETTLAVRLRLGTASAESGMSQTDWRVPAVIEARDRNGTRRVFAGCYTIHQTQPGVQGEPPFRPIAVTAGHLRAVDAGFDAAEATCTPDATP
ncbi:hypothetical protein [Aureimonas jatrophae]|uniref:Uncharacterized protein n=1 Tax=Aureimonas jatrophae TaxID=1166073 RepID=A0A1H0M1Q1_9HYPH|nr:hypothetical protein [Aureimonas jatrophae]MBB3952675.1 hypothetical protein [Aureimonas jatrophae]SDO74090.1 hypothetical protein SAMN05192530_11219 [Aureimonas jatrophae]